MRKALLNRVPTDAQKTRARDGAQRVFGIEQACDAQLDRVSAGRSIFFACRCGEFGAFCDIEFDAAFDRAHVAGDQIGVVAVDADGEQLRGGFRGGHDLIDVFGAKVYDSAFALVENAELAFEIIFERGVLGGRNMVAADVEEAGDVQGEPQHAVVFERLTGNLHDHMGAARSHGIGKVAPQIGRFGRRVAALEFLDAVVGFDGAKNRGAHLGGVHNGVQHV